MSGVAALRLAGPLVLVVGLLLIVGLAAVGAGTGSAVHGSGIRFQQFRPPACHLATCRAGTAPPPGSASSHPLLHGPFYLAVGMAIAVVIGLLLLMVVGTLLGGWSLGSMLAGLRPTHRRQLERPVPDDELGPDAAADAALQRAVDSGLTDLSRSTDPRAAVIACWVTLERAAAAAGLPRRDAETSAELAARLLRSSAVQPDVAQALSALYREARFSPHEVDEEMRTRARALLQQMQVQLAAAPPPTAVGSTSGGAGAVIGG